MKTYQFREMVVAFGFVTLYLSIIIYGFIWLQRETNVNDRISTARNEINKSIDQIKEEQAAALKAVNGKVDDLEVRIMPSAFKGLKTGK